MKVFQQLKTPPAPEKYPYAWRWWNHILTFESEFSSLPGDPTKEYTAYGPESAELTLNPAKAPETAAAEDDDDEKSEGWTSGGCFVDLMRLTSLINVFVPVPCRSYSSLPQAADTT